MVSNIFGISPQTSQGEFAYKHDVTVPAFKEAKSGAADASINNGTPTIGSSPSVEKLSSQMVLLECTTRHPKQTDLLQLQLGKVQRQELQAWARVLLTGMLQEASTDRTCLNIQKEEKMRRLWHCQFGNTILG